MSERTSSGLLFLLFLVVGALAWSAQLRPRLDFDTSSLANLSESFGDWQSSDIPLDESIESMLRADFNIQRAYKDDLGQIAWLYIGYYGTERGGKPEHRPKVCYAAHGWNIEASTPRDLGDYQATEYVVEKNGERRLVLFWFRSSRGNTTLSSRHIAWDHLLNRVQSGRADGSLIRLSTPLPSGQEVDARSRLLYFVEQLNREFETRWPAEKTNS
jgi:EpsI family protein